MRLDGFGLFVEDMPTMIRFYRDVLGFEITEGEDAVNVYLIKEEPFGLSLKPHDHSQRANGFLTLAGGVIITFAKEILDLIMA